MAAEEVESFPTLSEVNHLRLVRVQRQPKRGNEFSNRRKGRPGLHHTRPESRTHQHEHPAIRHPLCHLRKETLVANLLAPEELRGLTPE